MAGEKLEFPIGIPVDTNASAAADSVESLRDQIEGSVSDIKAMSASLRQLRGSSDEVKAAKAQLTTKIDALKNSVSGATLSLVKQGSSYDAASQAAKKLAEQQKKLKSDELAKTKDRANAMGSAISAAGGPVAALKSKFDSLKSVLGETGGSAGMGLVAVGAAAAVAAVAVMVAAITAGTYALGKFILLSGNTARSAGLLREAWSGTAENAKNLGTQVDALANKVPTSKAALNDLSIKLMGLRLPGQATVDTFNAIGQASAALGDEAAGKLQDFITRGRQFGMMRLDKSEMLEGFGNLDFDDVAKALAKGMGLSGKAGVESAAAALRSGRVKLDVGAKAMRDAIESKFGNINLRKMMSLEVLTEKLHEKFAALTSGVSLEPLLKPLSELGKLFDESTVAGSTLKLMVTTFGTTMVSALTAAIPLAKAFFEGMVIGALRVYIKYLDLKNAIKGIFGDSKLFKDADTLKIALQAGEIAIGAMGAALVMTAGFIAAAAAPVVVLGGVLYGVAKAMLSVTDSVKDLGKAFINLNWSAIGKSIPAGLVEGLKLGAGALADGVENLAEDTKKRFKAVLGIHSPSKVFAEYGENTAEGYAQGVEKGGARASSATSELGASAPSGTGGRGGAPIIVNVNVYAGGGGGSGGDDVKALSDASFLAKLTKAVEDALVGAGIPVLA